MQIDNICVKKTYTKKDGTEKTIWNVVGSLKTNDDGKKFIELPMFNGIVFYVFPRKEKEENGGSVEL